MCVGGGSEHVICGEGACECVCVGGGERGGSEHVMCGEGARYVHMPNLAQFRWPILVQYWHIWHSAINGTYF